MLIHRKEENQMQRKRFYEEMAREWSTTNRNELVLSLGDFNGHVGKCAESF